MRGKPRESVTSVLRAYVIDPRGLLHLNGRGGWIAHWVIVVVLCVRMSRGGS